LKLKVEVEEWMISIFELVAGNEWTVNFQYGRNSAPSPWKGTHTPGDELSVVSG